MRFLRFLCWSLALSILLPLGSLAKDVQVKGYTRKDGTQVAPYTRSAPGEKPAGDSNTTAPQGSASQGYQSPQSWENESPQIPGSKSSYTAAEIDERLGLYFRIANMVVPLSSPVTVLERDVSEAKKAAVIRRDGGKCIICGSTVQLEVDHRVALMNGGSNDLINLATLCDACHLAKTRMDGSLRRQREKNLGK